VVTFDTQVINQEQTTVIEGQWVLMMRREAEVLEAAS